MENIGRARFNKKQTWKEIKKINSVSTSIKRCIYIIIINSNFVLTQSIDQSCSDQWGVWSVKCNSILARNYTPVHSTQYIVHSTQYTVHSWMSTIWRYWQAREERLIGGRLITNRALITQALMWIWFLRTTPNTTTPPLPLYLSPPSPFLTPSILKSTFPFKLKQ